MPRRKQVNVHYKVYKSRFENKVKRGVVVRGCKYDEYVEEQVNLEDFRQCYQPGFKPREELPKYWFVSKEGFLINAKGNGLSYIKPNLGQGRPQFTINTESGSKNKRISSYGLVGLVWGSYIEPDAYKMMEMNGIDCIGSNPKKDENGKIKGKVQPHHTEGYLKEQNLENYILNNRPEYIEFLTNKDHTLIGGLTGNTKKDMKKILDVEYKYDDVIEEHTKVFAHTQIDIKTGEETKIAKVLTTEEANRMVYKILASYVITENEGTERTEFRSQKLSHIEVKAKDDIDTKAYLELSQEEKIGIQNFIKSLFKQDRTLGEVEFRYKEISMIARRMM